MKMKREIMAIARAMGGIMEDKRSYLCYWARVSSQITDHRSQITDHRSQITDQQDGSRLRTSAWRTATVSTCRSTPNA